jgi:hypothetical protein
MIINKYQKIILIFKKNFKKYKMKHLKFIYLIRIFKVKMRIMKYNNKNNSKLKNKLIIL